MAAIQGLRGTGEFSTDFRPKNYRELFTLLEPNGNAPLNALLSMPERNRFLRHMSHELKTPLTSISLFVEMLRQKRQQPRQRPSQPEPSQQHQACRPDSTPPPRPPSRIGRLSGS
mgnify:CR=1 FL=1